MVVWLLVVGGGSAWATVGHTFVGQFGGLGNDEGQFGEPLGNGPVGVAVMPSSGDVFTVDAAQANQLMAPRVQRFSADGAFQSGFLLVSPPGLQPYNTVGPVAVDPAGSGAVYISTNRDPGLVGSVVKYSADGTLAYELDTSGSGTSINSLLFGAVPLAVDPVDGTVYVAATVTDPDSPLAGAQVIDRFDGSTGEFIGYFDGSDGSSDGGFCSPSSLAVDGSQRIYVLQGVCPNTDPPVDKNRVDRYGPDGLFQATVDDGMSRGVVPRAVAADPVSDEVYVAEQDPLTGLQITHFSAGGAAVVYTFDAADATDVRGMSVSGAGTVYTSDASTPFVERFTRFDGPSVVTGDASSVEARSVVLEGTINPEGAASSYRFEYGTDLTYGKRVPAADTGAGSGSGVVAASATLEGLEPNKAYHFRIVGSNASGSIVGADKTFTTVPAPATVGGSPAFASAVTPESARLHGTINPNNAPFVTNYSFEYGLTTAYGTTVSGGSLCFFDCGGVDQSAFVDVSGLEPGRTYHFRVVADNLVGGPQVGADQTFVTAPAAGGGASDVTARRARLTGTINPHGVATSYHFNYGPTATYGSSTPEVDAGSGDGDQLVAQEISGLSPGTTYHVQVVATSADGVIRSGGDGLFRTAQAPTALAIGPTGLSTDAATVAGEVNTFGLTGTYHFDVWSLDSSYAVSTAERPVAGSASAERVSTALSGLPAGETFAVQLSVSSNDAIGVSDLATFATAEVPRVFPPPPASDGASVYGCASPRLDAYNARPKPGDAITATGQDLGVGGSVMLGDRSLKPSAWSATGFTVVLPEDAKGSLALTVNCGRRSNTIAVAVFQEPENGFSVPRRSVSGSTATLAIRVSAPGKLESSGARTKAANVTVKKPGTATIKIKLTRAGARAITRAKSHTLKVKVRVRFTPAGGRPASKTVTITFKRKGGR